MLKTSCHSPLEKAQKCSGCTNFPIKVEFLWWNGISNVNTIILCISDTLNFFSNKDLS